MGSADAVVAANFSADKSARLASAESALTMALSSAPDHALAHAYMGLIQIHNNRAVQGIAECERALVLNRNIALAHGFIGLAKIAIGCSDETETHIQEAFRLSPRDQNANRWAVFAGAAKLYLGREDEAVAWLARSIEFNRNSPLAHFLLAAVLARRGKLGEAESIAKAGLALDPGFTIARLRTGALSDNPAYIAERERAIEGMRKAGVPER
jgi:tetratricopeptide (TPR) repeat protein